MSFRRAGRSAAMVLAMLICVACGQVYRPVVIPCSEGVSGCPVGVNPFPANFHAVFAITTNVPSYPGEAMQIDVSGDSVVGATATSTASSPNSGLNPTHAATSPNHSAVFVATAGSVSPGGLDSISLFTPMFQSTIASGLGPVTIIPLPTPSSNITAISESGTVVTVTLSAPLTNLLVGQAIAIAGVVIPNCSLTAIPPCNPQAYNGTFAAASVSGTTVTYMNSVAGLAPASGGSASLPPQPVFLNSTQNNAMYVVNYNSNSLSAINTVSDTVVNTIPVGINPVSLVETPNALKLYVANQGGGNAACSAVCSLNPVDLSQNVVTGFTGVTPVWMV